MQAPTQEIAHYVHHHAMYIGHESQKAGDPVELARAFLQNLSFDPRYQQTEEMVSAIAQAIRDFRAGNVEVLPETRESLRLDRICQVCRACFAGENPATSLNRDLKHLANKLE